MTSQVEIRPLRLTDAKQFASYANNKAIFDRLTDGFPHPYTVEIAESFIQKQLDAEVPNVLAITINDSVVGAIGIHPKEGIERLNGELGYWVAEPFWGKGIASVAIAKMIPYVFKSFSIDRIFARPYHDNPASQRVLEKAGFKLEARLEKTLIKNGELKDELIYAVRRESKA